MDAAPQAAKARYGLIPRPLVEMQDDDTFAGVGLVSWRFMDNFTRYDSANFRYPGPFYGPPCLGGFQGQTLVARIEDGQAQWYLVPNERNQADRPRLIAREPAALPRGERDVLIKEKDLDVFSAVRKELELDLRVGTGDPLEHRSGQIGAEALQRLHGVERDTAQLHDELGVLLRLVQGTVRAQFCLDLIVARQ